MTIEEAENSVGKSVTYRPWTDAPSSEWEYGVITSVANDHVFVLYTGDINPKSTQAEDLDLQFKY